MCVGIYAERLSRDINGVRLSPKMAKKRDAGENKSVFAGKTSREVRQSPTIDDSYCGQSIGQNDRKK
jgi:hypothetical protein